MLPVVQNTLFPETYTAPPAQDRFEDPNTETTREERAQQIASQRFFSKERPKSHPIAIPYKNREQWLEKMRNAEIYRINHPDN